jgi:hypothetical protein
MAAMVAPPLPAPARRAFLRLISAGAGGLVLGGRVASGSRLSAGSGGGDATFEAFQDPRAEARPFFRWWWNGNRVTRDELLRELRLMHAVGAGGVEINPIGMHEAIPNPSGRAIPWLGDEWTALVAAVAEEAERLGLVTDLIVGTGWPFGGEFLRDDETIQGLELEVVDLEGPGRVTREVAPRDGAHRRLLQARLFPAMIRDLEDGRDVTSEVGPDGHLALDVPSGPHRLYLVTWRNRFRDVFLGAPGGDGPVLDHFNRPVVERYLEHMADRLEPTLGRPLGRRIRAVFCDSIELEGANWTGDLPRQFEARRSYALDPWLPLVLQDDIDVAAPFADTLRRVRFDYSLTLAELFVERFIEPFHEWCHAHGMRSRYQAYGYPWIYTDLLEGYRVPDIPEGDQWLFNRGWVRTPSAALDAIRYSIWNKYASSAGHLEGRRIVSSEAMTNTSGVFEASLEYVKQATDLDIVGGINHLVLHGFNYSPPEAGLPGWMRFGTWFNEHNPWWPHARRWFDYAARLSQVFQDAEPVAQVALMGPTPDVWSDHGLDRNPWNGTPWYLHALWQALSHHGFAADYVNGSVLQEADLEDGEIRYGPMRYEAVVLTEVQTLSPETADALGRYADAGGRIAFVGEPPRLSAGLVGRAEDDARVRAAVARLLAEHPSTVRQVAPPREDTLVGEAGQWMDILGVEPAMKLEPVDDRLFFTRSRSGEREILFLANVARDRDIGVTLTPPVAGRTAWRWDPETGERSEFGTGERLPVSLGPLESLLLVFEPGAGRAAPERPPTLDGPTRPITGPWTVRLEGMDGVVEELRLEALTDLSRVEGLADFSGTATYRTRFETPSPEGWVLDLGDVREISEVRFNGTALGVRWYGRRRYDLTGALEAGANELEIVVTTLAFNHFRAQAENPMAQYWMSRTPTKKPLPTGLIGPVRLLRATAGEGP